MTKRPAMVALAVATATLTSSLGVDAYESVTMGGEEGEIDVDAQFVAHLGRLEPTERASTWQDADTKLISLGAGYTFGAAGPLLDLYLRIEGGYYIAEEESIEDSDDDLPVGYTFYDEDKGGFVAATLAANFVRHPRFTFGAFLRGTAPIDVNLAKFSNVHLHYVAGGATVGLSFTDPEGPVGLGYRTQLFVGSGAYDSDYQHNAAFGLTNLFALTFERWLLPWPAGVAVGPYFEADLNEHVDHAYHDAYAAVTADYVKGDRVRAMQLAIAVLPHFYVTDHAAIELAWVPRLASSDVAASQLFSGGLRAKF